MLRLVFKKLSFSRYAYDGEDQCLSPLPHNGDLSEKHKRKAAAAEINSTLSVDEAKMLLKENAQEKR